MTQVDVFIGHLADGPDPLDWGGAFGLSNVPARIGPFFPPGGGRPFSALVARIKSGAFAGQQTDWGAWAANVSKQEVATFIEDLYAGVRIYSDPSYMPHLYPKLDELRRFVAALEDERVALVAIEV